MEEAWIRDCAKKIRMEVDIFVVSLVVSHWLEWIASLKVGGSLQNGCSFAPTISWNVANLHNTSSFHGKCVTFGQKSSWGYPRFVIMRNITASSNQVNSKSFISFYQAAWSTRLPKTEICIAYNLTSMFTLHTKQTNGKITADMLLSAHLSVCSLCNLAKKGCYSTFLCFLYEIREQIRGPTRCLVLFDIISVI